MEPGPHNIAALMLSFARCTPHKSHFGVEKAKLDENTTCDLCGAHHADGVPSTLEPSFLPNLRGHLRGVHHADRISAWKSATLDENATCDLYGAHHADGTSSTLETSFLQAFFQDLRCHLRGAHHTDRISAAFRVSGLSGVPNRPLDKVCGAHHLKGAFRVRWRSRPPAQK